MKRKRIEVLQDVLMLQLNHWIFVVLIVTILNVFGQENLYLPFWIFFGIVPVFLHSLRKNIHKKSFLYLSHLLMVIVGLILPLNSYVKALMIICLSMYVLKSIGIRASAEKREEKLLSPAYFALATIVSSLLDKFHTGKGLELLYLAMMMTYFVGYVIYYFVSQYLNFMKMNEHSASNIPEKEIFFVGMKHSAVFAGGSIVLLIVTANLDWFSKIMSVIGNGIVQVLSSLLSNVSNEEIIEAEEIVDKASDGYFEMFLDFEWLYMLLRIFDKVILVLAVFLVIGFVYNIIIGIYDFIRRKLLLNGQKKASKYQDNQDVREYCTIDMRKKEKRGNITILNNRERIRKIFRKQILKNKKDIIGEANQKQLEYLTAKECCDKLDAENMKQIYEKARYSAEDVTVADVRLMKR